MTENRKELCLLEASLSDRKEDGGRWAVQSMWGGRESFPDRGDHSRRKGPLRESSFE